MADDKNRCHHQTKEEAPEHNRLVLQRPLDAGGQRENGGEDAGKDGDQEGQVEQACRFANAEVERGPPEFRLGHHANTEDQLLIDAQNEGHCTAGDARHHVGAAHGEALGRQHAILCGAALRHFVLGCRLDAFRLHVHICLHISKPRLREYCS